MKDDERIEWIDRIYDDIKTSMYLFNHLVKEAQLLSQRLHDETEINNSRALNGIK